MPNKKKIYTPGINAAFNAGPATISGFALYQFGTIDFLTPAIPDVDINGYALDLRGDMNLGPGKVFLEGLYISGGDNDNAKKIQVDHHLQRLERVSRRELRLRPHRHADPARNADDINTNSALIGAAGVAQSAAGPGNTSPGNGGRGIWHIGAGYTMPLGKQLTAKVGAGYLAATKTAAQCRRDRGRARRWAPRSTRT